MAQKNIETATTNCPGKKRQGNIADFLKRALAEAQRKNPLVIGLTYAKGKIEYRHAKKAEQRRETTPQATLETLKQFFKR